MTFMRGKYQTSDSGRKRTVRVFFIKSSKDKHNAPLFTFKEHSAAGPAAAAAASAAKSLQLCLTLCDPIDSNPPGSPVPGIFQARTLE